MSPEVLANNTIPAAIGTELVKAESDFTTEDIIREVINTFELSRMQLKDFAAALGKGKTDSEKMRAAWHFVHDNVRYIEDREVGQFPKTPARLWSDGFGDCKSFSVFIASLLYNWGIPFSFRFTSYNNNPEYTHVYIIAHGTGGGEIPIDAVYHKFGHEKPFTQKLDIMPRLAILTGIGATTDNPLVAHLQEMREFALANVNTPGWAINPASVVAWLNAAIEAADSRAGQREWALLMRDAAAMQRLAKGRANGLGALEFDESTGLYYDTNDPGVYYNEFGTAFTADDVASEALNYSQYAYDPNTGAYVDYVGGSLIDEKGNEFGWDATRGDFYELDNQGNFTLDSFADNRDDNWAERMFYQGWDKLQDFGGDALNKVVAAGTSQLIKTTMGPAAGGQPSGQPSTQPRPGTQPNQRTPGQPGYQPSVQPRTPGMQPQQAGGGTVGMVLIGSAVLGLLLFGKKLTGGK